VVVVVLVGLERQHLLRLLLEHPLQLLLAVVVRQDHQAVAALHKLAQLVLILSSLLSLLMVVVVVRQMVQRVRLVVLAVAVLK